ncbi:MAG TPA: glycosyl hydrolase family 28-related protein [Magnetospirillaceae bacterium]|nr:glycosyl hydrolase family 28-related protein [Magnetospirillaceae bacterium]
MIKRLTALLLAAGVIASAAGAEPTSFPKDSGYLDVRAFGAKGDGKTDDTQALLKALAASGEDTGPNFWHDRLVWLPNGTYKVSGTLLKRYQGGAFASGLSLIGESREHTIIRLVDHAPGFNDSQHPQAVIFTSSKLIGGNASGGGKDYVGKGEGNDAYMNFVENLTVEVGNGNPGAIAIDFLGNNLDAIRNVSLKAPAGSGAIGLSMMRKWPGPTLVSDLSIDGFPIGLATAQTEYGLTFDHIKLRGQSQAAIRNEQNSLAIRDLDIEGNNPVILNAGDKGFLAIEGGHIAATEPAALFRNEGIVTLRKVGLGSGVTSGVLNGRDWQAGAVPDWITAMGEAPAPVKVAPEQWVSPARFGAMGDPDQDATQALRDTFATGAAVIYLPHGTYAISDGIEIPSTVQRIVGMNSTIRVLPKRQPVFQRTSGMMRVNSAGAPLIIERLAFDNTNQGDQLAIDQTGGRDLVLRDIVSAGTTLLDRKAGGGAVFLEDVCCGKISVAGPQPVAARQFDTEGSGVRITNRGAPLSILGLKTEGVSVILDNSAGGHSDIFGGLVYVVRDGADATLPAFHNTDGWLSASFVEESLRAASRYQVYIGPAGGAQRSSVPVTGFPSRGFGRFVPNLIDEP